MSDKSRKTILTIILIGFLFVLAWLAERCLDEYVMRVVRTGLIYVIAAVGYNLINGIAGQFSLGPNGFMALGGYMVALLMLPGSEKNSCGFFNRLSGRLMPSRFRSRFPSGSGLEEWQAL